jgi:hypothetical protein
MSIKKSKQVHDLHKNKRHNRLDNQIFGIIHKPIIIKNESFVCDLPSYTNSKQTSQKIRSQTTSRVYRNLDMRCFFTGTQLTPPPLIQPNGWNHDSRLLPWLGTRDHLVPARRDMQQCPFDFRKYPSSKVWCSNVVNVTLGLVPLPVRLKLRQWLQTDYWDRNNPNLEDGTNLRWLIIHYLDHFRMNGRYPWSRNKHGCWWYPEISQPFMNHMCQMELEFLKLNHEDRNLWINKFDWRF